ncbi:MAG TPA: SusC/RagA family TonB-linked outer membrane protein [Prolixibacteraceae bacterium]|nr:SusC/RagA family TonB-linked outer membrane protein [Prolixibacteraceae bacterium]
MKLTILIVTVSILSCFSAETYSQNTKLTIAENNSTLLNVLKAIEAQSEFKFFYNEKVDVNKEVSVEVTQKSVTEILDKVLSNSSIKYKVLGRQIALYDKDEMEPFIAEQQGKKVTGKVTDAKGATLPGVSVIVKGTTNGVSTDNDGFYSIPNIPENATLQFSFVGMKAQEIFIGNKTTINILLNDESIGLDDVVVVGYGTQRKGELTSSVSSVKSADFIKGAVQDAAQLLKGKVAGLHVIQPNGDPTSTSQIILRGVGTLKSGTSPLVIIDGVPGDLNTVAPEDIESMDVVKDGSAAAIYGTRGNNGVIFITTKKVRGDMPLSVEVSSYITTQKIKKKLDMMNATQYRELVKQGKPGAIDYGYDTDWLDLVTQIPVSTVTNASLKGGNTKSNYIANINFKSDEGIIKTSDNKVITTRLEVNQNMWNDLLKLNLNIMGREQTYHTLGEGSSFREDIYKNALANIPTDRPKDDNGKWVEHPIIYEYMNALALLEETIGQNKSTQLRTFGSATLTPIDHFFIKALYARTTYNQTRGYSESKNHISTIRDGKNGYASKGSNYRAENLLEITSQYRAQIGGNVFTGLVGYSYQDIQKEDDYMQNWDFPSDDYTYNNMGAGAAILRGEAVISSYKMKSTLIGIFARVNYNYKSKYLASFSMRHEGSSKFGADNKWGNFPAASLGWSLNKEGFLKEFKFINNLKLRVGFGVTGTEPNDPYISLGRLTSNSNFQSSQNTWIPTLKPSSNANPDLRWETKEEWNIGVDYGFLDNRISGGIDYYLRKTKDMLWDYQVAMPPYLYSSIVANAGTMANKGIEVNVGFIPIQTKNIQWSSRINYSTNKNKIVSLSNDKFQLQSGYIDAGFLGSTIKQGTHRLFEGGEVGNFYGFKTIDIDSEGKWIIEGKDGKPKPIGEQLPDDKQVIGNGLPKHFLSWDNSITYKKFDLNITMRGAFDYQILNLPRLYYECPVNLANGNLMATAFEPKFGKTVLSDQQELQYVSYFIENGDFWKIDNVTIGYTLSLKHYSIEKLRLYASGSNLFTITGYSGIDPEMNTAGLDPGIDSRNRYPSTRSFTFGALITF